MFLFLFFLNIVDATLFRLLSRERGSPKRRTETTW